MSRPRGRFARSKARQGDSLRHQIPAPCPHSPPGFTLIGALSGYFYVSLGFNGHFVIPNLAEFRDTAPLSSLGTSIGKTKHTS